MFMTFYVAYTKHENMLCQENKKCVSGSDEIGSVAERVKAPFLRRPCDHNRVI